MVDLSGPTDLLTYRWVARTLRVGMYVSFGAMGLGLVWWLLAGAPGGAGSAEKVLPFDRLLPDLVAGNPLALLNLGVVLLLVVPGVSLLAAIITFAAARNRRFAGIAGLVGAILLLSLVLSVLGLDKVIQTWVQSWVNLVQGR
ncbi:MAG: DUF1634 domain-containing protein [Chloroflexia bacterium]